MDELELEESLDPEADWSPGSSKLDEKPSKAQHQLCLPDWACISGCILLGLTLLTVLVSQLIALHSQLGNGTPSSHAAALLHYQRAGIGTLFFPYLSQASSGLVPGLVIKISMRNIIMHLHFLW